MRIISDFNHNESTWTLYEDRGQYFIAYDSDDEDSTSRATIPITPQVLQLMVRRLNAERMPDRQATIEFPTSQGLQA